MLFYFVDNFFNFKIRTGMFTTDKNDRDDWMEPHVDRLH